MSTSNPQNKGHILLPSGNLLLPLWLLENIEYEIDMVALHQDLPYKQYGISSLNRLSHSTQARITLSIYQK